MTPNSVQPRDRIFVEGYGLLFFARNIGKMLLKIEVKNYVVNTVRNFLILLNNLLQIHFQLLQKEQFKKQQKRMVI